MRGSKEIVGEEMREVGEEVREEVGERGRRKRLQREGCETLHHTNNGHLSHVHLY